jgi:phosphoribosylaminoimidazole-succinocarboxamide synthase
MFTVIHDVQTDEITQVPLAQDEIDVIMANRVIGEKLNAELEAKAKAVNEAKQEILNKLGITVDEIKLLLS